MNRDNHRHRVAMHGLEGGVVTGIDLDDPLRVLVQFLDVDSGAKAPALGANHDHPHFGISPKGFDVLRQGLNRGLGFSAADRSENIRRTAEVARLFADAGLLALVSFISPYAADRQRARELHAASGLAFFEVHVDCPLPEAERRDPKGLYRKARAGEIKGFTGIDDPYEAPQAPELRLPTHELSIDETVEKVLSLIEARGIIAPA